MPTIRSWEWDEGNLGHLARPHPDGTPRPRPRTIRQVGEEAPRFRRNLKGRAASHQMIGPDAGGTLWVVCIVETHVTGTWRAITGWPARDPETTWYRRSR